MKDIKQKPTTERCTKIVVKNTQMRLDNYQYKVSSCYTQEIIKVYAKSHLVIVSRLETART